MSVDISNHDSKRIKLEDMNLPLSACVPTSKKTNQKKFPSAPRTHDDGKWRLVFLPSLIYWVGNSKYAWSIPDETLKVCPPGHIPCNINRNGCFEDDSLAIMWSAFICIFLRTAHLLHLARQSKTHEWRRHLVPTAISILMAFFASMPQYNTQERALNMRTINCTTPLHL